MTFKRNEYYDNLIIDVKENKNILEKLDYEELTLFINYLLDLNKYSNEKKANNK